MWDSSELEERNSALGTKVGPDGSARETLADYGNPSGAHRFRFIRRDGYGRPEQHDNIDDVVYIQRRRQCRREPRGQQGSPKAARAGSPSDALPSYLKSKVYTDFRVDTDFDAGVRELALTLGAGSNAQRSQEPPWDDEVRARLDAKEPLPKISQRKLL